MGRHVRQLLDASGHTVVMTSRRKMSGYLNVGEIGPSTQWLDALEGVEIVIHLAARVHVIADAARDPLDAFRIVNVAGTEQLARAAANAGVRTLVFLSTVGIVGRSAVEIVDEGTQSNPANAYAISKLEAEMSLLHIAKETDLNVVVLRSPLVYGPGAPGSLVRLRSLVEKGVPIPLGSVENHRSAIAVENLASAITDAMESNATVNRVFYVEDGTVWSSPQMVEQIGQTIGRRPRLVPVPIPLLRPALTLIGRKELLGQLLGSLVVDGSAFRSVTGWIPPTTVDDAFTRGVV